MGISLEQWKSCTELWLMQLQWMDSTPRKQRLIAAAFCRSIGHLFDAKHCQKMFSEGVGLFAFRGEPAPTNSRILLELIEQAEGWAEEELDDNSIEKLKAERELLDQLSMIGSDYYACYDESWGAIPYDLIASSKGASAISYLLATRVDVEMVGKEAARAIHCERGIDDDNVIDAEEEARQCAIIREILPPPFGSVSWQKGWRSSRAVEIATLMGSSRDYTLMPELAEALRDAGCGATEILEHCFQKEPHFRGCWVLDWVLDQE